LGWNVLNACVHINLYHTIASSLCKHLYSNVIREGDLKLREVLAVPFTPLIAEFLKPFSFT